MDCHNKIIVVHDFVLHEFLVGYTIFDSLFQLDNNSTRKALKWVKDDSKSSTWWKSDCFVHDFWLGKARLYGKIFVVISNSRSFIFEPYSAKIDIHNSFISTNIRVLLIELNWLRLHDSYINSYLLIWKELQSVPCPFINAANNVRRIIFQSILSIWLLLRPTRWDRLRSSNND